MQLLLLLAKHGLPYLEQQPTRLRLIEKGQESTASCKGTQFYSIRAWLSVTQTTLERIIKTKFMALILEVQGKSPQIPESCFVVKIPTIVGDVKMGNDCSVWFNAIIEVM